MTDLDPTEDGLSSVRTTRRATGHDTLTSKPTSKDDDMPTLRSLAALLAAATLALTGCSGDGTPGGELSYEDSPLSKYFRALYDMGISPDATQQEQQAFYDEQNRKQEELIAQCMTDEGFEYVPSTQNGAVVVSSGDEEDMWRPDDRDWVEKYGYGAINSPWREQEETQAPEATEPPSDPNQEYVESLTEAEQQAYSEALWGKPQEPDPDADPDQAQEWRWQDAGCYGWAQHEVQGDNPWEQEENKPIIQALNTFYQSLQTRPEFVKLDADWSACMTEAGFGPFKTQSDAQNSIYELQSKYWEQNSPQSEDDQNPDFGTMKDPEFAKLADEEIPLALADLDCREKTDYRQQQMRIQFAAEEQFIADHAEELDAMKARVEQAKKK